MLPLYGGGGEGGLSRFFYSNRRFDSAMVSFVECYKEVRLGGPRPRPPSEELKS